MLDMPNIRSRSVEDYLEAIYVLDGENGTARTKDIAKMLSVSPASVTDMMAKLGRRGLVEYERYSPPRLTPEGKRIGRDVKKRHDSLLRFFTLLGVAKGKAQADACAVEHELSPATIRRLERFVEFAKVEGSLAEDFRRFCKAGDGRDG